MAETSPLAQELRWVHHDSVDSTNDLALAAARQGGSAGLWVTADRQLKGRGRGGRGWRSEPGNFHGSHLYVADRPVAGLSLLPLAAGLAVRDAIAELLAERAAGQPPALKWPNDVLIGGRKVAGILLESEALVDGRTAVAIGCGINLAHHPAEAAHPATHLAEHGVACTIADVLPVLARRMADALALFEREPARLAERWLAAAHGIGGPIRVRLPSTSFSGLFAGLDSSGRLILEEAGGGRRLISAGEVFFGAAEPAGEDAA
jgi:BirA family transcriptional regulator, biotin operon repressor / biotin---[acetyl-CoA-carboxylase] ligase